MKDDDRGRRAATALASKPWNLDLIEALLTGLADADQSSEINILRRLTVLDGPDLDVVCKAAATVRRCADRVAAVAGTDARRARDLCRLLTAALAHHRTHAQESHTCPLCGTPAALGETWESETEAQIARITAEATEAEATDEALHAARDTARRILPAVPAVLSEAHAVGIDAGELLATWSAFSAGPTLLRSTDADEALAAHWRTRPRRSWTVRLPSASRRRSSWTGATTSGGRWRWSWRHGRPVVGWASRAGRPTHNDGRGRPARR